MFRGALKTNNLRLCRLYFDDVSSVVGNVNLFSISYESALFNFVGCMLCHTRSMKTASTGTTALSEKTSTHSPVRRNSTF